MTTRTPEEIPLLDAPGPGTQRCQRLARGIGLVLLAIGLTVPGGIVWEAADPAGRWQAIPTVLQGEFVAGMTPMAGSTALLFALSGLGLTLLSAGPSPRRLAVTVVAGVVVVAALVNFVDGDPITDLLDWAFPTATKKTPMSKFTAVFFLMAAAPALSLVGRAGRLVQGLASAGVCGVALVSLVFLLGHAYGVEMFKVYFQLDVGVALLTALAFLALAIGSACALGPDHFPLRPFVGNSPRALMLRWLLPIIVGLLVLDTWARCVQLGLSGLRESVRTELALASASLCLVSVVITTLVIIALSRSVGSAIDEAEQRRDAALDQMRETIADLYRTRADLEQAHHQATEANRLLNQANQDLAAARDKAEQSSVAKDFFLATVSHELRTPLNHVQGFLQLLELTDLADDQRRDLAIIRTAANNLESLVNDLLDYQKMIQGVLTLEPRPFDLRSFVAGLAEAMRSRFTERGTQLVIDCPDDVGVLDADEKRVRQALTNLLTNAAKFTRAGTVTVIVRHESDEAGDRVCLAVEDTGRGLTPEQQTKLFQPFTKLLSRSENPEGTGLGLALSQRLCRLMGGDLTLTRSEPGVGSTFTILLPATPTAIPAAPARRPVAASIIGPTPGRKPISVLVIDDEPEVRELMRRHLTGHGFAVHLAASGAEGLEMVKRLSPDAITLDVLMPGIDGWGTLAALQGDAETAHIPVILITMLDDRSRGVALGAWEVLSKPVNWSRLIDLLQAVEPHTGPVLVVDDDPSFRAMGERTLQEHGWEVCCAESGPAALVEAARRRPSLVLLDLLMPDMDGFEFLERFRAEAAWRDVPVVVVTAREQLTTEEQARLDEGVLGVLCKGMSDPEGLLREIERLLRSPGRPGRKA